MPPFMQWMNQLSTVPGLLNVHAGLVSTTLTTMQGVFVACQRNANIVST